MTSKEQAQNNDKDRGKQKLRIPVANILTQQESPLEALAQRARSDPHLLTSKDVLQLQRISGNRAVSNLLAGKNPRAVIQTKLTVGAANDVYEQQADRVAAQVMRTPALATAPIAQRAAEEDELQAKPLASTLITPLVQRSGGSFEAGAEFENRLASARGSGMSLPEPTRDFMEQRMGADFSGVKVHTDAQSDQLNQSIQAKAFTTGRDVFFRNGAYQPGSQEGQQLLAHELTHVVQQGAASRTGQRKVNKVQAKLMAGEMPISQPASTGVVQRAIGYEFETNFKVEKQRGGFTGLFSPYRKMQKMETIKNYTEGFKMEADENTTLGSTIEFVVDPPVQENNRGKLVSIMNKIHQVAGQIDAGKAHPDVPVALNTLTGDATHANIRITPTNTGLTSNPQVTGGVSFDKIISLLSEMGGGSASAPMAHRGAAIELEAMAPQAPLQSAVRGASVLGTAEFKGMTAFLTTYIRFGQKQTPTYPPLNYTKLVSNSLLLRTDFASMFKKLNPDEQEQYVRDPASFVDVIMSAADPTNKSADLPVIERGVRKSYRPTSKDYTKLVNSPATRLTRRQWLTGITQGVDLLSTHHMPALQSELEGLGALGPTTDKVGGEGAPVAPLGPKDKGSGIVMEFRNMRKNVPFGNWSPMALGIFDYLSELNSR